MSVTTCLSGNAVKLNGAMTITAAGNIPAGDATKQDLSLRELTLPVKQVYGSHVVYPVSPVSSSNLGLTNCLTGGIFSYQAAGKYIIPQVSTTLNGSTTTLFRSTSSKISNRPNNRSGSQHTAFTTAVSWVGQYDGLPHYTVSVSGSAPNFGTDYEAAYPAHAAQFTYRTGKPSPVMADYTIAFSD